MRLTFLPVLLHLTVAATVSGAFIPQPAHAEEDEEALKARLIEHLDGIDAMEARVSEVRLKARQLPSAQDLDLDKVSAVHDAAWEARALVPAATATAAGFREAWPELQSTLERFLSKSDAYRKNEEVQESLQVIESASKAVEGDLNARSSDYADSMHSSLEGLASELSLMAGTSTGSGVHARNASKQADEIEALALALGAIYPWEPALGSAPTLPMDERQRGWSSSARDALAKALEGRDRAQAKVQELKAAARARIASARFPTPKYAGGSWDVLAAQAGDLIATAWKVPRAKVLRVGIDSDWQERREWAGRSGSWRWEHYRFFWVRAAVELDGGRCRVYSLTFRQDERSGSWSALYLWGVSNSFEMLLENVLQ